MSKKHQKQSVETTPEAEEVIIAQTDVSQIPEGLTVSEVVVNDGKADEPIIADTTKATETGVIATHGVDLPEDPIVTQTGKRARKVTVANHEMATMKADNKEVKVAVGQIVRWMGAAGWKKEEAAEVLKRLGATSVPMVTISTYISDGKRWAKLNAMLGQMHRTTKGEVLVDEKERDRFGKIANPDEAGQKELETMRAEVLASLALAAK